MGIIASQLSIAIVDDERSVRTSLARLLRSSGMHAEVFSSGSEFSERLSTGSWQVVLLDIHMPGLTGFELLKLIQEERPELCVIMITGYEGPDVRRHAFEAGAKGFLLKPFAYSELFDTLQKLCDHSAQMPA
jgi:FixJ family two-component response regulator